MALGIYLAGPEVFLPDAKLIGQKKVSLCKTFGFEGLFPLDNEVGETGSEKPRDIHIYQANVDLIRRADLGIFNLTPFRGVSADPGTVFELGMFVGMGKPVFGYSNDDRDMLARLVSHGLCETTDGIPKDADGMAVEDFGGSDNLMITCSLAEGGYPIVRTSAPNAQRFSDLTGFQVCLEAARAALQG